MMRVAGAVAGVLALCLAAPAQAFGPYPHETWAFTLEFKRMQMTPTCHEEFGRGKLVRKKGGRNPVYELTGFPAASVIACTLPNGGTFDIDAARFFDLPADGFWKGPVELMGPGDIKSVRAIYSDKRGGLFIDGTFYFETIKGRIREHGGSEDMYHAVTHGARR